MKKNFLTKVMTLVLAATMALTPVTASAAEKTVITAKDVDSYFIDNYDEETEVTNYKALYDSIAAMDGCYQENGYKIYTALNGKIVTFNKTGNYSVIVGGKTAKKDQGSFKFVAPKTGTYKFTFTTKDNVAGSNIYITPAFNGAKYAVFKVNYGARYDKKYKENSSVDVLVTNNPKAVAFTPYGHGVLSRVSDNVQSSMTKVSGSIKLKKGQYVKYTARQCGAAYDEADAYNFTGFDLKITKTK